MMSPHLFTRDSMFRLPLLFALAALLAQPAAAATIHLKNTQEVVGAIDEGASDETFLVVKTKDAVLKIPRAKIESIDQQDATPANGAAAEQSSLKQAESALASDPANEALRRKVEELRNKIKNQAMLNYGVFFEKLDMLLKAQRYEEAVAESEAIVWRISDPGAREQFKRLKAQAHIGLAHKFHEFVNYRQEEENFVKAMEEDPENPAAPLELGDLLQLQPARRAEAVRLYEKGIALADSHPGTIDPNVRLDYENKLAELYINQKQYVAAGDRFLNVMLKDTTLRHPQAEDAALAAYSRLPVADMDDTTRTHVINNTRKILAAKPTKQAGYLLLGRIFYDQKKWTEARDNLLAAIKNTGPRPDEENLQFALFSLAISHRKLRQDKEAAMALQRLLAMRPRHYDALCELADILVANDSYPEAQQLYEQAMASESDKHRAHLGKGLAEQKQGKFDDARKSFKAVLERDDKNAPAQLAIARSYFAEKKYDETLAEGEKVLQLIRDHYKKEEEQNETPAPTPAPGMPGAGGMPMPGMLLPGAAGSAQDPNAVLPGAAGSAEDPNQVLQGTAGSAEDPIAQTTQTANAETAPPNAETAPPPATAAAAPATTETAAALPATTEIQPLVAAPATTGTTATAVAAAIPGTTATLAAAAGTTQTAAALLPTTQTAAQVIPGLPAEAPAPAKIGGIDPADLALLDVMTPEDRKTWAEATTLIGKAHALSKRTNQARDFFNVALKFDPQCAEAYEGIGLSYAEDQLDQQAVEGFQKAIELDPENPEYILSLATYYHKTRKPADPAKALAFYKKYQELGGHAASVEAAIKELGGK